MCDRISSTSKHNYVKLDGHYFVSHLIDEYLESDKVSKNIQLISNVKEYVIFFSGPNLLMSKIEFNLVPVIR